MLTKTDFMLYQSSPLHLWADKHNKLTKLAPSAYDQHLMSQGYAVEKLAHIFLSSDLWQETFVNGEFEARSDARIRNTDGTFDLYEVKSATSVDRQHIFDAVFQVIAMRNSCKLNRIYILTVNPDYVFKNQIDVVSYFKVNDVTDQANDVMGDVEIQMYKALNIIDSKDSKDIENCLSPKVCPCIDLCYPDFPEKSIFNIPQLYWAKKRELVDKNILDLKDIPDDFFLTSKQKLIKDVILSNTPHINKKGLEDFLNTFVYPLYFLDYETYPLAVPIYSGYKPYQQMVFQYSLHKVLEDGTIEHSEFLETEVGEPSLKLLESLKKNIGNEGSVITWNKSFEFGRNVEMASVYPEYKDFLENVNSRMIDLPDFINKELYIHPDFMGSWSIKNVLPVMVPELSYKNLKVNKGDIAMLTWWNMIHSEDKQSAKDLLEYCSLDTMAMVKIWEKLIAIATPTFPI